MPHEPDAGRTYCLGDFDFFLPPKLIAQHPASERSGSRLLDGTTSQPIDRIFRELPTLLRKGDLLVFNDTRVMNARLFGEKATGGKLEMLIERVLGGNQVAAHLRVSKKPAVGETVSLVSAPGHPEHLSATLLGRWPDADGPLFRFVLCNDAGDDPYTLMARHGHVPLPPYITHADSAEDAQRYQTVFAKNLGAVAAPTAALIAAAHERGLRIIAVGRNADGAGEGIRIVAAAVEGFAQKLELEHCGRHHLIKLPLVGEFQIENALVAAGLAIGTGSEPGAVFASLEGLEGAKGRLEQVGEYNGAPIFVDYAHKPDALAKALQALRPYAERKLVVVFGCGGDRDAGKRPLMGAIAAENADQRHRHRRQPAQRKSERDPCRDPRRCKGRR